MAAEHYPEYEAASYISIKSIAVLETQPKQYLIRGSIALNHSRRIGFIAFRRSRHDDSQFFISIQEPRGAAHGWLPQEVHQELVDAITEEVEDFWKHYHCEEQPILTLVPGTYPIKRIGKIFLTITVSLVSTGFLIRAIQKNLPNRQIPRPA